jgi:glycosyltransferase involved in cell wall biosynthesis
VADQLSAIEAAGVNARARFGDARRPLTPLHGLAEFCYVVRRDVIDAVGAADEGYGLGPCWEMDYNVRAARAGFLGLWACGAYVHRLPLTARRKSEEARRFQASRERYQDKFCARRLRGDAVAYEAHCKGDECVDFAPAELIRISEPLDRRAGVALAAARAESNARAPVVSANERPLVSCIMPTRNRRAWIPQAIRLFLRQDFADAELVILDDGDDPVRDCVPDHPRITYHRSPARRTIGAKRNEACRLARGDFIAHWDDDDWHSPSRIRRQVEALTSSRAELCGTSSLYFYEPIADRAWRYRYASSGPGMLVGTSLLYKKSLWQRLPFADIQIGEDVRFVRAANGTARDLADPALCVATIHGGNTSRRNPDNQFWSGLPSAEIHRLIGEDLPFYLEGARPLVSCIMPTFNRRKFVELSLQSYADQEWSNRELVVVDDGTDPVEDLVAKIPGARYMRLDKRTSIGNKRNIACAEARGELIAHWDDDDWYARSRLTWQAAPILTGEADLTGLENRFVLALPSGDFWTTRRELHRRMFVGDVHGGTIVFRRSLFTSGVRYPDASLAEDAALIREVLRRGQRVKQLENPGLFVYVRHGRNAWQFEVGRFLDPQGWSSIAAPASISEQTVQAFRTAATV